MSGPARGWFTITVNTVDISVSKPDSGRDVAKALASRVVAAGG